MSFVGLERALRRGEWDDAGVPGAGCIRCSVARAADGAGLCRRAAGAAVPRWPGRRKSTGLTEDYMKIDFAPDPSLYPFESHWFDSDAGLRTRRCSAAWRPH